MTQTFGSTDNTSRLKLRFAVGDANGLLSNVWLVSKDKRRATDDIYIQTANTGRIHKTHKITLHQSGICRYGFTAEGHPSHLTDRAQIKWKRPATPQRGESEWLSRTFLLAFPTTYLRSAQPPGPSVIKIPPAPAGHAVFVEMFYTRENYVRLTEINNQGQILGCATLNSGEAFVVRAIFDKWDDHDVIMPASHHRKKEWRFTSFLPIGFERNIVLDLVTRNPANGGGFLSIVEIAGYEVDPGTPLPAMSASWGTLTRNRVDEYTGKT